MDLMSSIKIGTFLLGSLYFYSVYNILSEIPENPCECGEKLFCYQPIARVNEKIYIQKGLPFSCELDEFIHGIEKKTDNLSKGDPLDELTIITYASSNHFSEAKMMIYMWRYKYPKIPIVFYSLGLRKEQKNELVQVCRVNLRELDLDKYPKHLKNLENYAFKMAILGEAYKEFPFFYLMDSSLRPFNSSAFTEYLNASYEGKISPFSLTHLTPQTNTMLTHFGMYAYLPIQKELNDRIQFGGGSILVRQSAFSLEIVKWALLCAMTEDCIAPRGSFRECDFKKGIMTCHRYDQSMLNILLYNALQEHPKWEKMVLNWPYHYAEEVRRENEWNMTLPNEILCKNRLSLG